jgi:tRNA pseudouridine55 synthase
MNRSLVEIFSFDITQIAPPEIHFSITCSKGTYIRSIANDFGVRLQSGSYLAALKREASLPFSVQNANTMDEINTFFNNMKNN